MSLLFFVFPAFVLFPFCALLTCRQVASCRGVNEAQLCVTELIQSEGAFLFPSWTSSPPPQTAQFDREVKQIKVVAEAQCMHCYAGTILAAGRFVYISVLLLFTRIPVSYSLAKAVVPGL